MFCTRENPELPRMRIIKGNSVSWVSITYATPAMQPRGLRNRQAGYAAYASAFGYIAGIVSMCIGVIGYRKVGLIGNDQFSK